MRWAWLLTAAAACGSSTSVPLSNPAFEQPKPEMPQRKLLDRPKIDIARYMPDFHDELRWPLTAMQHPALEPRYAIADALAKPGPAWIDLCQMGAQNRYGGNHELNQYLRGWCNAVRDDVDGACTNLLPLFGSLVPGLDLSVRTDVANILANSGHAETAVHWLNKNRLRDSAFLDLLAADYIEVGTRDDAFLINELAIQADTHPTDEANCMRWTRSIVLANDSQSLLLLDFHKLATKLDPEPSCDTAYRKLRCNEYIDAEVTDPRIGGLLTAYMTWPFDNFSAAQWLRTAQDAISASTLDGGTELALVAIENAITSDGACASDIRNKVLQLGEHPPYVDDRIDLKAQLTALRSQCDIE
jgi:hypothetical protein